MEVMRNQDECVNMGTMWDLQTRTDGTRQNQRGAAAVSETEKRRKRQQMLVLRLSGHREVIGAERRRGQSFGVDQIDHGIIGPAIARSHRMRHLWTTDNDIVRTAQLRIGPNELPVLARDAE